MASKNTNQKLDFDHRVSQHLSLPYKNYTTHDGNALELLSAIGNERSYSIEWSVKEKRFVLTVDSLDGLFGQMFKGETVASVIRQYFLSIIDKKKI